MFAEPAIGALKTAGSIVDVNQAPYLYTLLNDWADVMVLVIGIGVGFAAVLGTIRFIYGWNLKPFVYLTLLPTLALTGWLSTHPELSKIIGLAWDCGAVTTGPVTVPLVLSLGIGIVASAGKGNSSLSGFGIVMLASLDDIIKAAQEIGAQGATIYYARGGGVRERLGVLGLAIEVEKEVISIIVATNQIDRVFEKMFIAGKLDTPGMGIMYVTHLDKVATYIPQEIVDKLAKPIVGNVAGNTG